MVQFSGVGSLARILKDRHGLELSLMTVLRDLRAIQETKAPASDPNILLLKDSSSLSHLSKEMLVTNSGLRVLGRRGECN